MRKNNYAVSSDNTFHSISSLNKEVEPLFNAISDPVLIIDKSCIIKKANTAAKNTFKFSDDNGTIKHSFLDLILEEDQKRKIFKYLKSFKGSEVINKVEFIAPSKLSFNAHVHISKNTQTKNHEFTLLLKKDINHIEDERTNNLKSEFLAQMSHEIRTPLNTMLSFTNLIEDDVKDKVSEDVANSFNHINSSGRRIIRTIDLLLNLSEIHSGTFEYIPQEFCLMNDILKDLQIEYGYLASLKKLDFQLENDQNEYLISADIFKVKEILKNLIENAIRFTESGKIIIKLSRNSKKKILLEIIDTGIGISKQYLPHLFTPFTQEERGYTRKYDGNGVGLTLVKSYCEINNIDISVKSEKNIGTKFILLFNNS